MKPNYEFTHAAFTPEAFAVDRERAAISKASASKGLQCDSIPRSKPTQSGQNLDAVHSKKTIAAHGPRVKILKSHDVSTIPIGVPITLREDLDGLFIAASLNTTTEAMSVAAQLRHLQSLGKLDAAELTLIANKRHRV